MREQVYVEGRPHGRFPSSVPGGSVRAMTVYVVAYDVQSDANRTSVEEYLEGRGKNKCKLQLSMYLIDSSYTAAELRDKLVAKVDAKTDRIWVSTYASAAAWKNTIHGQVKTWLSEHGH